MSPGKDEEHVVIFRQHQLPCLSLFSYLIGDETTGRAVVVDPQRDVSEYVAEAQALGLTIERVIETHFHADLLSGHLELAAATGATISYGEGAQAEFPIEAPVDGQLLSLGEVTLEVRATPATRRSPSRWSSVSSLTPSRGRRSLATRCSSAM